MIAAIKNILKRIDVINPSLKFLLAIQIIEVGYLRVISQQKKIGKWLCSILVFTKVFTILLHTMAYIDYLVELSQFFKNMIQNRDRDMVYGTAVPFVIIFVVDYQERKLRIVNFN